MKIERLKKSHKKQVVIGAVAVCVVGGALTFATTRAKYKLTESIPLVRGTVNYKVPDLRTVALYTANDSGTYVETNDIPTSGYQLNKTKSVCKVYDGTTSVENAPVDSSITIEYRGGQIYIGKLNKRNTRCYLYFDKQTTITMDSLIDSLPIKIGSPNFNQIATTDEGVYAVNDGMYGGTSYYWRGTVTNNYVQFAGKCWRMVRINGDKSVRLIYDGATCHTNGTNTAESIAKASVAYNAANNQSNYVGWTYDGESQRPSNNATATASNAKTQLERWYSSNIGNNTAYASKVADGKYCNDRDVRSGSTWVLNGSDFDYAAHKRIVTDRQPTLSCNSSDVYTLKIGLITVDELMYAGGLNAYNTAYYLYNGQAYWTMSPARRYASNATVFYVSSNGYLDTIWVNNTSCGLRPVINLRTDATFKSGGNGTLNNPYVVN